MIKIHYWKMHYIHIMTWKHLFYDKNVLLYIIFGWIKTENQRDWWLCKISVYLIRKCNITLFKLKMENVMSLTRCWLNFIPTKIIRYLTEHIVPDLCCYFKNGMCNNQHALCILCLIGKVVQYLNTNVCLLDLVFFWTVMRLLVFLFYDSEWWLYKT